MGHRNHKAVQNFQMNRTEKRYHTNLGIVFYYSKLKHMLLLPVWIKKKKWGDYLKFK